jgi:hypothetical protein
LQQYDVDEQVLARWRDAQKDYLQARAALIRQNRTARLAGNTAPP